MRSCVARSSSFESLAEPSRISACVPDCNDSYYIRGLAEIDAVGKTAKACLPDGGTYVTIVFRSVTDRSQDCVNFGVKLLTKARPLFLIPRNCLDELRPSGLLKTNDSTHFQPNRLRASSRTCSQGTPLFGLFLNASARRSSSPSISGLSAERSSPKSAQSRSAICNCSTRGKARTRSIISAALIRVK
jgi:hypothetical protein